MKGDIFAGFCYIESWDHEKFVANSGLIVKPEFRGKGLAKAIKKKAFELSRSRFPNAKIFGLTTGAAVMKINTELGYVPVTFEDLTTDPTFWKGCESCINYDVLTRNNFTRCPQHRRQQTGHGAQHEPDGDQSHRHRFHDAKDHDGCDPNDDHSSSFRVSPWFLA